MNEECDRKLNLLICGDENPDFSLVIKRSEIEERKRNGEPVPEFMSGWPPLGSKSDDLPVNDSDAAIEQWLRYQIRSLNLLAEFRNPNWIPVLRELLSDCQLLSLHRQARGHRDLPPLPGQWGDLNAARADLLAMVRSLTAKATGKEMKRRKRRRPSENRKQLTARQAEIVHLVAECKGNIAEAARRIGRDRKTVEQHYKAAMVKMGQAVTKPKTVTAPSDRRGQSTLSDDKRRSGR